MLQMISQEPQPPFESLPPPAKKLLHINKEEDEDEDTETTTLNRKVGLGSGGAEEEVNGRERLKRHRCEVAGRVWVPDMWGQEGLLKDWADCNSAFDDASLLSSKIMASRAALIQQARTININHNINNNHAATTTSGGGLFRRIHNTNRC